MQAATNHFKITSTSPHYLRLAEMTDRLKCTIEFTADHQCFVKLDDGTRIAKREDGKWVRLHPNWIVGGDYDVITIEFVSARGAA